MINCKEYKNENGESIFIILNASDVDLLEAQKHIVSNGYIIMKVGRLLDGLEAIPVVRARKPQE